MRIVIPDDYQDAVRGLACFSKLAGHDVTLYNDTVREIDTLAERFQSAEALVLIRERTRISDALLARLPRLRLISQTGKGTPTSTSPPAPGAASPSRRGPARPTRPRS